MTKIVIKDYAFTFRNWQLLIWPLKQFASHLLLSLQQPETVQVFIVRTNKSKHGWVEYETSK
jgi:hypothetical protein